MQHKIFSERVKVIFKVIKKLQHNHLITKAANSRPSHGNIYQHFFFQLLCSNLECFTVLEWDHILKHECSPIMAPAAETAAGRGLTVPPLGLPFM